jgi:hypothetical protein
MKNLQVTEKVQLSVGLKFTFMGRSEFLLQKDSRRLSDFPGTCECFQ